ncbi:MAG: cytochrome P450, partial [Pseudomonadota bacterium]
MDAPAPYRPPAPVPKSTLSGVAVSALFGRRDVLSLFPEDAYSILVSKAPVGKRPIYIVNAPKAVRKVLINEVAVFPKSDLMVGALTPLVGDGIFISAGDRWKAQRAMIDPAFAHMRIRSAYQQMTAATDDFVARLDGLSGETLELDEEMSHLTADIVFRTIFSEPIVGEDARAVFRAFAAYQNAVPQIDPKVLLSAKAWQEIDQPREVIDTCALIREKLGVLIDRRLADGERRDDIAGDVIAARDAATGEGFTREELIDQIAVFFLAGHETSASALTWAFFILSQRPETLARVRAEVDAVVGDGPVSFEHTRKLTFTR